MSPRALRSCRGRGPRAALLGAGVCALLFMAVLLLAYGSTSGRHADASALNGLSFYHSKNGAIDVAAERVRSLTGALAVVAAGACLVAVAAVGRGPRVALAVAVLVVIGNASSQVAQQLVSDPAYNLGYAASPAAFPSGHAAAAMTLALCAVLAAPRRLRTGVTAVAASFAVAEAISLLLLRSHYPSDVVGGFLLATACGLAVAGAIAMLGDRPRADREEGPGHLPLHLAVAGLCALAGLGIAVLVVLASADSTVPVFVRREPTGIVVGALVVCVAVAAPAVVAFAATSGDVR